MFEELNYWRKGEKVQNFGDFLSEFLVRELFLWFPLKAEAVYAIGSVISAYYIKGENPSYGTENNNKTIFWGCGARVEDKIPQELKDRCLFLSVRGPLTIEALGLPPNTVIGDPALLLPLIYEKPKISTHGTILVPHFFDERKDEELINLSGCDIVIRPNIQNTDQAIHAFLSKVLSAEFVLCGSLHAAIVRAAYGLPFGYWDSGCIDTPFKWKDFSLSVGINCSFQKEINSARENWHSTVSGNIRIPSLLTIISSAPYISRQKYLIKAAYNDSGKNAAGDAPVFYNESDRLEILADSAAFAANTQYAIGIANHNYEICQKQLCDKDIKQKKIEEEFENLSREIRKVTKELEQSKHEIEKYESLVEQINAQMKSQVDLLQLEYKNVINSRSWKFTWPLRLVNGWISNFIFWIRSIKFHL